MSPKERQAMVEVLIAAKVLLFGPSSEDHKRAMDLVDKIAALKEIIND